MNLYETLGVPPDATPAQIRKAHKKKVKAAHPDTGGTNEQFLAPQLAYEVLSDDARRARYDRTGEAKEQKPIRVRATEQLVKMADSLVSMLDVKKADMVAELRRAVIKGQTAGTIAKDKAHDDAARLRDAAARFTSDGPVNPFKDALLARADNREREAAMAQEGIDLGDEMLKVLQEFSYRVDANQQVVTEMPIGGYWNGTFRYG